ncbi:MAG: hypothetical protein RLZZ584_1804 [Pseudomonadota bacterium]
MPILDAQGRPLRIVLFGHEVTAVHTKVRDNEVLIQALSDGNCLMEPGPDAQVESVNDTFLQVPGMRRAEQISQLATVLLVSDNMAATLREHVWPQLREVRHYSGEFGRPGVDGAEIWLHLTLTPVLTHDQRLLGAAEPSDAPASCLLVVEQGGTRLGFALHQLRGIEHAGSSPTLPGHAGAAWARGLLVRPARRASPVLPA